MGSVRGITIGLEFDDKSKLKLRAIAKHVGALADELDAIDDMQPCKRCGSFKYSVAKIYDGDELYSHYIECHDCGIKYHDELPTRLEGSD